MEKGTEKWAKKRKVLSATFYKQQLINHLKKATEVQDKVFDKLVAEIKAGNDTFDLAETILSTFSKIILTCIFGKDISETKI